MSWSHTKIGIGAGALVLAVGCGRGGGDCTREGEFEIVVDRPSQLDGFGACSVLPGLLVQSVADLEAIELPEVEEMRGSLRVQNNDRLEVVSLPSLRHVEGELSVTGPRLHTLDLSSLEEVGTTSVQQSLTVNGVLPGGGLSLGPLTRAARLSVADVAGFVELDLSRLAHSVDVFVMDNPDLETVVVGVPEEPSGPYDTISISGNPALTALELRHNDASSFEIVVVDNDALARVDVPNLEGLPALSIRDNDILETIDMPSLTAGLDVIEVTDNPALSYCEVQDLIDAVEAAGGETDATPTVSGNLEDSCSGT